MRRGAFPLLILALVLLHFLLHVGAGIGRAAPDLLAVASLIASRRASAAGSAALGLVLGLLEDAVGIGRLGARSIALAVAAMLGSWSRRWIEGEGLLFLGGYVFIGKWTSEIVLAMLARSDGLRSLLDLVMLAPLEAAWAGIAAVLAMTAYRKLFGADA